MNSESLQQNSRLPRRFPGQFWYWSVAIVMAGLYAAISWITPYYLDDWVFMGAWRDDVDGGYEFSFATWWKYFQFIRSFDNGRISNALSPMSTMFSPWKELFPIVTGVMVAWIAVTIQKIACGRDASRRESLLMLAVTWALMIVSLPWSDTIIARDYALNYIWSAGVTLTLLWLMIRGRFAASLLMAVLAGGWHEGFAIPTLCGLGLYALLKGFRLSPRFYIVVAVYVISTLLFLLSPGLMRRISHTVGTETWHFYALKTLLILIFDAFVFLFWVWLRPHVRGNGIPPVPVVCLGIIISGFVMGFLTTNTFRSYFWPDLAAVCLCVWMLKDIARGVSFGKRNLRVKAVLYPALGAVVALCCVAQSIMVIVWEDRYRRENAEILELVKKSETGIVYFEMKYPARPPFYTFGIPIGNNVWLTKWHPDCLRCYYIRPQIKVLRPGESEADGK